jgi:alkylhydroperoxidase family enzyme
MVQKRGWADEADRKALFNAGYNEKTVVAVITGIGLKSLSNYFNHQAETPVDEAFASFKWEPEKV